MNIGITENNRMQVAAELAKVLSDENVLAMKTRRAHWNVEGADFFAMHEFFGKQYGELDAIIDETAERIRTLGHFPPATMTSFLSMTQLDENTPNGNDSHSYLAQLAADHEAIVRFLRVKANQFADEYGDVGTSDFVTGLMQQHEKMIWMLRAHLKQLPNSGN